MWWIFPLLISFANLHRVSYKNVSNALLSTVFGMRGETHGGRFFYDIWTLWRDRKTRCLHKVKSHTWTNQNFRISNIKNAKTLLFSLSFRAFITYFDTWWWNYYYASDVTTNCSRRIATVTFSPAILHCCGNSRRITFVTWFFFSTSYVTLLTRRMYVRGLWKPEVIYWMYF